MTSAYEWQGRLIWAGSNTSTRPTGDSEQPFGYRASDVLPHNYIIAESYTCTPQQREEIEAYRDDTTRALYRNTIKSAYMKTKITFSTRPLRLADKKAFMNWFTDRESSTQERKIQLVYWDDEASMYKTGYFYRPNMDFKIRKISNDDIWYDKVDIELIQY